MSNGLVPQEFIEKKIYVIRGHKVMLDKDLAMLYGVATKVLNQAVRRNKERFPEDFMFQLTKPEAQCLRSQVVTLKKGRGHHYKYRPYAFTEPGMAMLSAVLDSKRAIQVNIQIIRTFIKLRQILSTHKTLAHKLEHLERVIGRHDKEIIAIFEAIRQLTEPLIGSKNRRIGFSG